MKHAVLTAIALLCAACPGTLDDPNAYFEGPSQAREGDASTWAPDAAPERKADASAAKDATVGGDARVASDWDAEVASRREDAAVADAASSTRDAAGPSCNFKALAQMRCGGASCHGSGGAAAGLDLVSDGLAARLAGRKAGGACSDALLVDPAQPAQSVLYRRVIGAECGVQMPLGAVLRSDEQACFLSWIEGL